jgi:hypothetical protein
MFIDVAPVARAEREDFALLSDHLQDSVIKTVNLVDEHNSHVETIPPTPGGPSPLIRR